MQLEFVGCKYTLVDLSGTAGGVILFSLAKGMTFPTWYRQMPVLITKITTFGYKPVSKA